MKIGLVALKIPRWSPNVSVQLRPWAPRLKRISQFKANPFSLSFLRPCIVCLHEFSDLAERRMAKLQNKDRQSVEKVLLDFREKF